MKLRASTLIAGIVLALAGSQGVAALLTDDNTSAASPTAPDVVAERPAGDPAPTPAETVSPRSLPEPGTPPTATDDRSDGAGSPDPAPAAADRVQPAVAAAAPLPTSLRTLADGAGVNIGTAVAIDPLENDDAYRTSIAAEFNTITVENELKWSEIHPEPGVYDFDQADAIIEFAERNGIAVRGHALTWHRQNPAWLDEADLARDEAIEVLRDHVTTVVGRYAGRIDQWDVVNEPLARSAESADELRDNVWLRLIGEDYIDLAFRFARDADPQATLFLNDYDGVAPGPKTDATIDLAARLADRGVEIDGIGFEFHVLGDIDHTAVAERLARAADLGFEVALTEVDNGILQPATPESLAAQADVFGGLLATCVSNEACDTFVMWGHTDRYSWIPDEFPGFGSALAFDEDLQPKPAYDALVAVLGAAI